MKMKSSFTVIELRQVTKTYVLHHQKPTLVEQITGRTKLEKFKALDKVSLTIKKGEKIGVVGGNGSGKTTLLKVIAGITSPSSGKVSTEGKIVSLINLGAGFHPDLTGEENIFLNGLLLGMSKKEIDQKKAQIIEFADIHQFIDAPFYTYSEGMKLRLGFSIAVHSDPDILILDEGIIAGDQTFIKKVNQKIKDFFLADKTIIVVSHWLEFLKKNCQKILWMEKGKIKKKGGLELLRQYEKNIN
jgi:ABC-type polysaccharide/polyol phosphate transport system ATPase subunit